MRSNRFLCLLTLAWPALAGCQSLSGTPAFPTAPSLPSALPSLSPSIPPARTARAPTVRAPSPTPSPVLSPTPNYWVDLPPEPLPLLPPDTAIQIWRLRMFDGRRGWALGGLEDRVPHLLRTEDGAETWVDVSPPADIWPDDRSAWATTSFLDPQSAWIGYYRFRRPSPIWRTLDGGQTWDRSWELASNQVNGIPSLQMRFLDLQHGWLSGEYFLGAGSSESEFFRTQDGGITWELELDQSQEGNQAWHSCCLAGFDFVDPRQGWAVSHGRHSYEHLFYRTRDGGMSWTQEELAPPSSAPPDLDFPFCDVIGLDFAEDERGVLLLGCSSQEAPSYGFLYSTPDGGRNWRSTLLPGNYDSLEAEILSPSVIYLLGSDAPIAAESSDLLLTRDGGGSWLQLGSLPAEGGLHFANPRVGWFLGTVNGEDAVLRTSNGGVTWERITPRTTALGAARRVGRVPPTIALPDELGPFEPGQLEVVAQVGLERPTALAVSADGATLTIGQADGRVAEWPLDPEGFPTVLARHSDWVYDVAYDLYHRIATASKDGTLRVWSRHELTVQWLTLTGHSGEVTAVDYSPDGTQLATASQDKTIIVGDRNLSEVAGLQGHTGWIWDVTFSPDGKLLASASEDRTARLWEVETGKQVRRLAGHTSTVSSVAFSPDGSTLATASWDGTVRLWDVGTGASIGILSGHDDWVYDVAFSPAGDLAASASGDGTVILWDPVEGRPVAALDHDGAPVRQLAFTPDGRLLITIADDGWVRFWGTPG